MSADFLGPNEIRFGDTIWHVPLSSDPFGQATAGGATIEWLLSGANPTGRDCIHVSWTAAGAGNSSRRLTTGLIDGFKVARGSIIHIRYLLKGSAIAAGWKPCLLVVGASATYSGAQNYNTYDVLDATSEGTFDWKEITYQATVNDDYIPSYLSIYLSAAGASSGECWMTGIRITVSEPRIQRPAATDYVQPITGLRGFQIHPNAPRKDFFDLRDPYNANFIRWQLNTWSNDAPVLSDKTIMTQWDAWFAAKLLKLQDAITWCRQNDLKMVVAMMVMPGGSDSTVNNLVPYNETFFNKYIASWQAIANLCKGAAEVLAFDVMNEPGYGYRTRQHSPGRDFRSTQIQAIDAIRAIDPDRWCVFQTNGFDEPKYFNYLKPIERDKILYSVHMYRPGAYVAQANTTIAYPGGLISGENFTGAGLLNLTNAPLNKQMLRDILEPVRAFQRAYRVPIYMSEFSSYRWTPGCASYLQDVSDIADEYGWIYTCHAFREANMWDVEYEALPANQGGGVPAVGITDRGAVLRAKFALNSSPYTDAEQAPIAPVVTVSDNWDTESTVSWTTPRCHIGSWTLEYRPTGGAWTPISVARDLTSKVVTGLVVGTSYDYRVTLVNPRGTAASSIVTRTKGFGYLLDTISAIPAYAYSTRQLKASYAGPAIRVRRTDGQEKDIAFLAGNLDMSDLVAFAAGTDAFLRTWYDGTGNGLHLQQATPARQPRIVSAGVVDVLGLRAAVNLIAASSHWMSGAFAPLYAAGASTIVGVWRNNASTADSYLFGESSSAVFNPFYDLTSGSAQAGEVKFAIRDDAGVTFSGNGGSLQVQGFTSGTPRAFRVADTGTAIRVASNTTAEAQDTTYTRAAHTLTANQTALGARLRQASADKFPSMSVGELIAFPATLTDADEATIMAHQVRWYGL